MDVEKMVGPLLEMGELALTFGRISRTSVYHPNGGPPESDTDHTVMLGWVAPSLAYRSQLNVGLVAEFALVHDAVEVYAGDTPTLRIDEEELAAKEIREYQALMKLQSQFEDTLPWFSTRISEYEEQCIPEARFVRAVDKILPKIVHLLDSGRGLREQGMGVVEFLERMETQRRNIKTYTEEWPELLHLHTALVSRVAASLRSASVLAAPNSIHQLHVSSRSTGISHYNCPHSRVMCPFTLAYERCEMQPRPHGVYELDLDERGELIFKIDWS